MSKHLHRLLAAEESFLKGSSFGMSIRVVGCVSSCWSVSSATDDLGRAPLTNSSMRLQMPSLPLTERLLWQDVAALQARTSLKLTSYR